ncbi:MAG: Flp pilus assembly protein CpaB [Gemmatimonadaceae bacterium]|jgi:pilus assembly protein CpaB|nr:Flp pilus assembly protein CpaB [Gemmatimonadaceae bacterium]
MAERRYTFVFVGAVLVAIAATFGVYRMLQATKESSRVATVAVVVASRDIPEGQGIERSAVGTNLWPVQAVPAGYFGSVDSVAGRVARVTIFKGEAIVPGRLAPVGTGAGLEVKITPGKRAMAVRINDVVGISNLVQPNSRVDVMVTIGDANSGGQRVAKLFMDNMRVLSVGTQVQRSEDGSINSATTATLEVTPDEAERLSIAMNQGSIQLVLRGYGDPENITTKGATSSDVLKQLREGQVVLPPVAKAPAPRRTPPRQEPVPAPIPALVATPIVIKPREPDSSIVHVIRGGKDSQQKVEKNDSTPPKP